MSFGHVRWALVQLNDWTWLVVQYRGWVIVLATVIGGAVPLLSAARRRLPRPGPSLVVRSGAMALALSAAAVAICSLLHFSDLRWLPPGQRSSLHLSAGGFLGFAKPAVSVLNTVSGLPVEWRAAQLSVHTAIVWAFVAVGAFALAVLTWRRARRADIRQIVQEEMRKATGGNRLCRDEPDRQQNILAGPSGRFFMWQVSSISSSSSSWRYGGRLLTACLTIRLAISGTPPAGPGTDGTFARHCTA
jgi:hypothetical protein